MRTRLKRLTSLFLALVMVFTLIPPVALAAGVNESLVSSLATVYDGDEERARADLEALYKAGVIDEDGNFVKMDVREDGVSVELDAVAQRIANSEPVGALTINGIAVTQEQLIQLAQVKLLLEAVRMLDQNVEITDEHVNNLQALLEGLADGSVDFNGAVENGVLRARAASPQSAAEELDADGFPKNTKTGQGTVDVTDGKYSQPLINGGAYEASHAFTLSDPENNTYYTDNRYSGSGAMPDGTVTLTLVKPEGADENAKADEVETGATITVKATLDKAQTVPVSFHWQAVSGSMDMSKSATTNGTVTWAAGETGDQTFDVAVPSVSHKTEIWDGQRAFFIEANNLKNATFDGGKSAWSQKILVTQSAADKGSAKVTYGMVDLLNAGLSHIKVTTGTYQGNWYWGSWGKNLLPLLFDFGEQFGTTLTGNPKEMLI